MRIPVALEQLRDQWEARDLKPPDIGRQLDESADRRAAGQRVRSWLSGENRITLNDAEALAENVGARIVLQSDDPWDAAEAAITALPREMIYLKRTLHLLVRAERPPAHPKARAADS